MIRIIKPADEPPELAEGAALVEVHEAARQADPKAGTPKITPFKFNEDIWKSSAVTTALGNAVGIYITGASTGAVIGSSVAGEGNLISGNTDFWNAICNFMENNFAKN